MRLNRRSTVRGAFTLVELLVVIAIIAVLVALTTAAVMRLFGVQPEKQAMRDMLDLSAGAEQFKARFGFYPPSKMFLAPTRAAYNPALPLHVQSLQVLDKMFPKLADTWKSPIDWTGSGSMPATGVVLEGDQCLVFFLGGVGGNQGFAKLEVQVIGQPSGTRNGNPMMPKSQVAEREGPFFEFRANRLFSRTGNGFSSFMDPWSPDGGTAGTQLPYVYFATRGSENSYDANHKHLGVAPYLRAAVPTRKYYNPGSFQIITAGRDRAFGPGGSPPYSGAAADDQANFHDAVLGSL